MTLWERLGYAYIRANLNKEEGQTMAEYGVVLALITLAVVAAFTLLGTNILNVVTSVAGRIVP
jgi:Flp pilus assembly pilin Flp